MLMWSPPRAIHINGIIQKYVVKITENETGQMWRFFAFNDEDIVVGSLHPHYHYDCRVAAFTIAEGTLSTVVTVQTEQECKLKHKLLLHFQYSYQGIQFYPAAPSAPPSLPVVFGTTHNSLSLNWEAPPFEETNGAIQNYVISIHEVETGRNFTANSNTTQVTLEPLHPYYTYMCSIAAETVARGPFSEHITIQLPEAGLSMFTHLACVHKIIYHNEQFFVNEINSNEVSPKTVQRSSFAPSFICSSSVSSHQHYGTCY